MPAIPVGLQLYSLRDACAADFYKAIRDAAAAGYAGVEFAGFFGKPAKEVRKVVEDAGLSIMGAHVGMDLMQPDKIDETIAYHRELGNSHLVVPALPEPYRDSADACRRTAEGFCAMVEKLKPQGMVTGYHSHFFDMLPLADGAKTTTIYDLIATLTPPEFILQIDVGNAVQAGACPVEWIRRYPGRYGQIHLKERYTDKWNLPIGAGLVPWGEIFDLAKTGAGTRAYIVEVEQYWDDPLECARQDRAILRNFGL